MFNSASLSDSENDDSVMVGDCQRRVCISIRGLVRWSVGWSVGRSGGWSVILLSKSVKNGFLPLDFYVLDEET